MDLRLYFSHHGSDLLTRCSSPFLLPINATAATTPVQLSTDGTQSQVPSISVQPTLVPSVEASSKPSLVPTVQPSGESSEQVRHSCPFCLCSSS